jgi:hypothetical protein
LQSLNSTPRLYNTYAIARETPYSRCVNIRGMPSTHQRNKTFTKKVNEIWFKT